MPNGGTPAHMGLFPLDGSKFVVYCFAGEIKVYERDAWANGLRSGDPLLSLSRREAALLAWFVNHWVEGQFNDIDYRMPGVNAVFDY